MADARLVERITELRRSRQAVILAHTYQLPEIQDIADFVGDSYGLSRKAAGVDAAMIVFCGVRFMAETAAILNPGRLVVMPDPTAGCPMADMISAEQLRALKLQHPRAAVVCYVNSTAEVKAESTVCCTSSNAVQVVQALREYEEIIFVPDRYLGRFVERRTGRNLIMWDGFCPTHAMIRPETVARMRKDHPNAQVLVHPECVPEVQDLADGVLSTGQMVDLVQKAGGGEYIIGTEEGILHTLRKAAPNAQFHHLSPFLRCPNMKKTTLPKVVQALEQRVHAVTVAPATAAAARQAIEGMLRIAQGKAG